MKLSHTTRSDPGSFGAYAALAVVLLGLTLVAEKAPFRPYLLGVPPVVGVAAALLLSGVSLVVLRRWGALAFFRSASARRFAWIMGLALAFCAVAVTADILLRFPRDLNVAWPQSLLFYPVIGFVAKTVFQVVPLALLGPAVGAAVRVNASRAIWLCIPVVATIEPVFQAVALGGGPPLAMVLFVLVHLYLFNLVELTLFKQQDFATSYAFRLSYYALWHLLWGYARLPLLFT